ncbi:zinc-binding dehydrogenase [Streptomyces sp. NPDC005507]|uniref:zinc-binding dehydrogenase n=1 Tax=Streptomyces sp. NPDC005507 TaxID=3154885 RepID=UPI0033BBD7C8
MGKDLGDAGQIGGGELDVDGAGVLLAERSVGMDEYWRQDPDAARACWRELWPLLKSGRLDPPLSSVFPLEQAPAALKHLDQRRGLGRTLLQIGA